MLVADPRSQWLDKKQYHYWTSSTDWNVNITSKNCFEDGDTTYSATLLARYSWLRSLRINCSCDASAVLEQLKEITALRYVTVEAPSFASCGPAIQALLERGTVRTLCMICVKLTMHTDEYYLQSADEIEEGLARTTSLQHFSFVSRRGAYRMSSDAAIALLKGLALNTTLLSFDVSGALPVDEGMIGQSLCQALAKNKTLQSLNLGDICMDHDIYTGLAEGLAVSKSLLRLNLDDGGGFDEDFALKLMAALKRNKSLQELSMQCFYRPELAGNIDIADMLKSNQTLRVMRVHNHWSGHELYRILKVIQETPRLHQFKHRSLVGSFPEMAWVAQQLGLSAYLATGHGWMFDDIASRFHKIHMRKMWAFMMGQHARLGASSLTRQLSEDAARMVVEAFFGLPLGYLMVKRSDGRQWFDEHIISGDHFRIMYR